VGKGTGLGLALVYGVMKSHGGRVEIASGVDRGTEIVLVFPALAAAPPSAVEATPPRIGKTSRLGILLVDDDDLIRSTVPAMLESIGHQVVALSGGVEALRRLQSGFDPDLVILDLSMPGMDGEETLERLRLLKPDVPVFLATGYRDERYERILERFSGVEVIMKPFTLMDLRARLARLG
jgi:CheY-like chemotaxis protein